MPPKTKPDPLPAGQRARALVSHYLKQPDGTFITYGRGSVLSEDQMSPESWAGYLADGRLELVDLAPIRLDPDDGICMEPRNAAHLED